jgi:hypothetical protein
MNDGKSADIRQFPLAWRWTDPTHTVLPDSVLAQLHPLDATEAARLSNRLGSPFIKSRLASPLRYPQFRREEFVSRQECGAWEASLLFTKIEIDDTTAVSLYWRSETALRTTWGVFRQHWKDFCYPSTDNVFIIPEDNSWLLFYDHEESFSFGKRKDKGQEPKK